jgi:hypothetical protein
MSMNWSTTRGGGGVSNSEEVGSQVWPMIGEESLEVVV